MTINEFKHDGKATLFLVWLQYYNSVKFLIQAWTYTYMTWMQAKHLTYNNEAKQKIWTQQMLPALAIFFSSFLFWRHYLKNQPLDLRCLVVWNRVNPPVFLGGSLLILRVGIIPTPRPKPPTKRNSWSNQNFRLLICPSYHWWKVWSLFSSLKTPLGAS